MNYNSDGLDKLAIWLPGDHKDIWQTGNRMTTFLEELLTLLSQSGHFVVLCTMVVLLFCAKADVGL